MRRHIKLFKLAIGQFERRLWFVNRMSLVEADCVGGLVGGIRYVEAGEDKTGISE